MSTRTVLALVVVYDAGRNGVGSATTFAGEGTSFCFNGPPHTLWGSGVTTHAAGLFDFLEV